MRTRLPAQQMQAAQIKTLEQVQVSLVMWGTQPALTTEMNRLFRIQQPSINDAEFWPPILVQPWHPGPFPALDTDSYLLSTLTQVCVRMHCRLMLSNT